MVANQRKFGRDSFVSDKCNGEVIWTGIFFSDIILLEDFVLWLILSHRKLLLS